LPDMRFLIGIKPSSCILAGALGLILLGSAHADGLNVRIYQSREAVSSSFISISTGGGSYAIGASAWHTGSRQGAVKELAPKAKIIDVKAAVKNPACTYKNTVCILRLRPQDTL
jgi:hypothetical protein